MTDSFTVTVYMGRDEVSRLAERVAHEAKRFLAREYGIPVEVVSLMIPVTREEAEKVGLPVVLVEDRVVSAGKAPLFSEIVEAVFDKIREEHMVDTGLPEFGVVGP